MFSFLPLPPVSILFSLLLLVSLERGKGEREATTPGAPQILSGSCSWWCTGGDSFQKGSNVERPKVRDPRSLGLGEAPEKAVHHLQSVVERFVFVCVLNCFCFLIPAPWQCPQVKEVGESQTQTPWKVARTKCNDGQRPTVKTFHPK